MGYSERLGGAQFLWSMRIHVHLLEPLLVWTDTPSSCRAGPGVGLRWFLGLRCLTLFRFNGIFRVNRRRLTSIVLLIRGVALLVIRRLWSWSTLFIKRWLWFILVGRSLLYCLPSTFLHPFTFGPTPVLHPIPKRRITHSPIAQPIHLVIPFQPFQLLLKPFLPHHDTPHHVIQFLILRPLSTSVILMIPYRGPIILNSIGEWP